mmetsp:Transcript_9562/g.16553  ORF Transcript_9562/g.16553 Transcript_9562/m.16553 type:complete len:228 (+) Transcript_9562:239-922(+)
MGLGKKPVHYAAPPAPAPTVNLNAHAHNLEMRQGTLDAKIKQCEKDLAAYKKEMQRLKPGTSQYNMYKQRALRVLKQKRVYEKQMQTTNNQQFNMDQIAFAKEQVYDAKAAMQMMSEANKQMKKDMGNIDLGQVEDLQDDMEDMLLEGVAISDAVGRSYDIGDGVTDADLEAELNNVEEELFEDQAFGVPSYQIPAAQQAYASPATSAHKIDPLAQFEQANLGGGRK